MSPRQHPLGSVFFTGKADGTVYAIVVSSQDGESMPRSVILPASLTVDATAITLVGAMAQRLPSSPARSRTQPK